ncbi:MAG: hypothetical protein HYY18_13070 [Planctomycetes bacterium]|nr:hypothetical protein [Planctomycetota bacterium]
MKRSVLSPAARMLADYMSDISEDAWCAGWMSGLEYALWRAVSEGPYQYGGVNLSNQHVERLRELSKACGGWIRFDDVAGETFVPIKEWQRIYARRSSDG